MDAEIGIIGGSGFYSMLEGAESIRIDTKYGKPSDMISIGSIEGRKVAFIPRHGSRHSLPPHRVPYRANIQALSDLGVKRIIATGAVGSLNPDYRVGTIAALSQFVNSTNGREDTFFDETVAHVSMADPYCDEMRSAAAGAANGKGLDFKESATVVVVNGPRFSTRAESAFFSRQGFDLINMTQYPEAALARERCMCYLGLGIVTDYDAGLAGTEGVKPVSNREVLEMFSRNVSRVKELILSIIKEMPESRGCECGKALDSAMA